MPRCHIKCCVPGCRSKGWDAFNEDGTKVSFHRFPLNIARTRIWVQLIDPSLAYKTLKQLNVLRVCGLHFPENQFLNRLKRTLVHNAVPVIDPKIYLSSLINSEQNKVQYLRRLEVPLFESSIQVEGTFNGEVHQQTTAIHASFPEVESILYICKFMVKQLLCDINKNCDSCWKILTSKPKLESYPHIADASEFYSIIFEESSSRRIEYPSKEMVHTVKIAVKLCEYYLPPILCRNNVCKQLSEMIKNSVNLSWMNCCVHGSLLVRNFLHVFSTLAIHLYCRVSNYRNRLRIVSIKPEVF